MIHSSAVVAADARLGAGVKIGSCAVIEEDVALGEGCEVAAHAVIKRHTRMGARNRVAEHAVIGGDPQDLKFNAGTLSHVEIGDDNVFREGVTVHRGSRDGSRTRMVYDCFLMAYAHVAHDCVVGDQVVMVNFAGISGEALVQDGAFLSGFVGVHQLAADRAPGDDRRPDQAGAGRAAVLHHRRQPRPRARAQPHRPAARRRRARGNRRR